MKKDLKSLARMLFEEWENDETPLAEITETEPTGERTIPDMLDWQQGVESLSRELYLLKAARLIDYPQSEWWSMSLFPGYTRGIIRAVFIGSDPYNHVLDLFEYWREKGLIPEKSSSDNRRIVDCFQHGTLGSPEEFDIKILSDRRNKRKKRKVIGGSERIENALKATGIEKALQPHNFSIEGANGGTLADHWMYAFENIPTHYWEVLSEKLRWISPLEELKRQISILQANGFVNMCSWFDRSEDRSRLVLKIVKSPQASHLLALVDFWISVGFIYDDYSRPWEHIREVFFIDDDKYFVAENLRIFATQETHTHLTRFYRKILSPTTNTPLESHLNKQLLSDIIRRLKAAFPETSAK